ncbi:TlrC/CarA/OleB/SrmB family ABC-F type ribosomal protection protein [Streptomyces spirodelae]|uniref:TlrC/CarA/OleB/SrmB family ABC-F type ribosomal protection protein n=1 Tax=Streptomyces spirodelae TaxID=2812904 RepID=A0ABS3WLH7_9ACTN|nr:TlrC/CarA/OleB/SrmB family ABC-F type ribosomal protection protein [Streptomyces spirodelae]MBO8183975.1 TlrC/CarA/OleB/SrmB family ABC-F type ribosomal protection protein [Streptomyces spirodelae]
MRTSQLTLRGVTKRYTGRTVLEQVSFALKPGEKAGLIGDNGSGKSTLLKLIAGQERPDDGELTVTAAGGIGYLPQILPLPPTATVQEAIDLSLADLRALEAELCRVEQTLGDGGDLDTYAALLERYEVRGGYGADHRVDTALYHLGLPALPRDRRLGTLSGGERSRLSLAAVLAGRPELLLLDEPTNDLDDEAVAWLEEQLRAHRGTVLAVTHDRVFLQRLTTTILEADAGRITRYGDGYAGYRAAKAADRRRRLREYEEWRAELARNERLAASGAARLDGIPRKMPLANFGHGGFRARGRAHGAMVRVRNARERVERLTANPVTPPADPLAFTARIRTAAESGEAIELTGVRVGGRLRLDSLVLGPTDRLLVTGPNGAGKTTLIRLLAGELRPDEGSVRVPGTVGHLRQGETRWPPRLTVADAFALGRPGSADDHAEALLRLGLFRPAELRLCVGDLSYGQRRRIDLARLVSDPADLLLLDEPTNHVSPALVEELEEALAGYPGAVVLVTHDRALRGRFEGKRLALEAGAVMV